MGADIILIQPSTAASVTNTKSQEDDELTYHWLTKKTQDSIEVMYTRVYYMGSFEEKQRSSFGIPKPWEFQIKPPGGQ